MKNQVNSGPKDSIRLWAWGSLKRNASFWLSHKTCSNFGSRTFLLVVKTDSSKNLCLPLQNISLRLELSTVRRRPKKCKFITWLVSQITNWQKFVRISNKTKEKKKIEIGWCDEKVKPHGNGPPASAWESFNYNNNQVKQKREIKDRRIRLGTW